jgi:spore maturation protein CgeB
MEVQSDLYGSNILEPSLTPDILEELSEHYELEKSSEKSFSDLGLIFSTTTLGF